MAAQTLATAPPIWFFPRVYPPSHPRAPPVSMAPSMQTIEPGNASEGYCCMFWNISTNSLNPWDAAF